MKVALSKQNVELRLLNGCLAGDRVVQEELYDRFSPTMFGICLRYSSDYHTAEDLLQEGFIKVFRNLHKYRGDGSFEGWIRRIFVNTAIENYRKLNNGVRIIELDCLYNQPLEANVLHDLAAEDLMRLVQKLPHGYRMAFNLYCIEGYSHKEIAEKLSVTEGTSKSQLARSKNYLKKLVQEQFENEEKSVERTGRFVPEFS